MTDLDKLIEAVEAGKAWARKQWCDWTHSGGDILRDPEGRVNWRCRKCGRWHDKPVGFGEERRATNRAISEARRQLKALKEQDQ